MVFGVRKIFIIIVAFIVTGTTFAQKHSSIECKVWKPESFCDFFPILNHVDLNTENCKYQYMTCEQLDLLENKVAICITFIPKTQQKLRLITGFKNMRLIQQNGNITYPLAMMEFLNSDRDKPTFLSSKSKMSQYDITFKTGKQYAIVLVFDQAKIGDKIVIDNFLEAIVTGNECQIWQPESFCNFPEMGYNGFVDINGGSHRYINCDSLDRMKNKTAVRITFTPQTQSQLHLKTGFENMRLVQQNGNVAYPFAVMQANFEKEYNPYDYYFLTRDSKINQYTISYKTNESYVLFCFSIKQELEIK